MTDNTINIKVDDGGTTQTVEQLLVKMGLSGEAAAERIASGFTRTGATAKQATDTVNLLARAMQLGVTNTDGFEDALRRLTSAELSAAAAANGLKTSMNTLTSGAAGQLDGVSASATKAANALKATGANADAAGTAARKVGDGAAGVDKAAASAKAAEGAFAGMGAAIKLALGYLSFNAFTSASDSITGINNKLQQATSTANEFKDAYSALFKLSQETGTSFEGNVKLFAGLTRALKDTGTSANDVERFIKSLNETMLASGASNAQVSRSIYELSEAFSVGQLQGRQLRSILMQTPAVIDLFAQSLGISRKELQELSHSLGEGADGAERAKVALEAAQLAAVKAGDNVGKAQTALIDFNEKQAETATQSDVTLAQVRDNEQRRQNVSNSVSDSIAQRDIANQKLVLAQTRYNEISKAQALINTSNIIQSVNKIAAQTDASFGKMQRTIAQAMTSLNNSWIDYVGKVNDATGANNVVIGTIKLIADNLNVIIPLLGTFVAAWALDTVITSIKGVGLALYGLPAAIRAVTIAIASNPWVAAFTVVTVAIGAIISAMGGWQTVIDGVKAAWQALSDLVSPILKAIGDGINDAAQTLQPFIREVRDALSDAWRMVGSAVSDFYQTLFGSNEQAAASLENVRTIVGTIATAFGYVASAIIAATARIIEFVAWVEKVTGFVGELARTFLSMASTSGAAANVLIDAAKAGNQLSDALKTNNDRITAWSQGLNKAIGIVQAMKPAIDVGTGAVIANSNAWVAGIPALSKWAAAAQAAGAAAQKTAHDITAAASAASSAADSFARIINRDGSNPTAGDVSYNGISKIINVGGGASGTPVNDPEMSPADLATLKAARDYAAQQRGVEDMTPLYGPGASTPLTPLYGPGKTISLTAPVFRDGGDFTLPGSGPPDTRLVSFYASPGERVIVQTVAQQANDNTPRFRDGGAMTLSGNGPQQYTNTLTTAGGVARTDIPVSTDGSWTLQTAVAIEGKPNDGSAYSIHWNYGKIIPQQNAQVAKHPEIVANYDAAAAAFKQWKAAHADEVALAQQALSIANDTTSSGGSSVGGGTSSGTIAGIGTGKERDNPFDAAFRSATNNLRNVLSGGLSGVQVSFQAASTSSVTGYTQGQTQAQTYDATPAPAAAATVDTPAYSAGGYAGGSVVNNSAQTVQQASPADSPNQAEWTKILATIAAIRAQPNQGKAIGYGSSYDPLASTTPLMKEYLLYNQQKTNWGLRDPTSSELEAAKQSIQYSGGDIQYPNYTIGAAQSDPEKEHQQSFGEALEGYFGARGGSNRGPSTAFGNYVGGGVGNPFSNFSFRDGGDFDVPGNGPVDSRLINMHVSPGERVSVRTPAQAANDDGEGGGSRGGVTVNNTYHVANPNDWRHTETQQTQRMANSLGRVMRRSNLK